MFGLFASEGVRETLREFHLLVQADPNPFWTKVAPSIERKIRSRATVHSLKEEGFSPRGLANYLVADATFDELASGRHHTYRGRLSMGGEMLLKLHLTALEAQIGQTPFGADAITEDKSRVVEAIKRAG